MFIHIDIWEITLINFYCQELFETIRKINNTKTVIIILLLIQFPNRRSIVCLNQTLILY